MTVQTQGSFRYEVATSGKYGAARPRSQGGLYGDLEAILGYDVKSIARQDVVARREAEADADYAAGRTAVFDSADDFLADLDD